MTWHEEDSITYNGIDDIKLFSGSDGISMMMSIKIDLSEVWAVTNGNYLHLSPDKDQAFYFAYKQSTKPGIMPFKIYKHPPNNP